MASHKVTRVWSVIVTALLAFFASLGLITTAAATPAVPQQDSAGNSSAASAVTRPAAQASAATPYDLSRPPTMKQRIRAEAHGSSPSSRGLKLSTPLSDVNQVDAATEAELTRERTRPGNSEELQGL
ncbi:DUF6344 domain-containing protein [Streptomyces monticola]|uniref:DUF6344 domain-containing protein n=1 Tax=Streptomyces monticola TaxID=2666263 RepID=A0ABW2JJA9_9ACTN